MIRAALAAAALIASAVTATAAAQEGEVELAVLPPPGPTMQAVYAEGEASALYPEGTVLPDTAYVCVPEGGGLAVFRRSDGELLVVEQSACAGGEAPPEADPAVLDDGTAAMDPEASDDPGTASAAPDTQTPPVPDWTIVATSGPDAAHYPAAMKVAQGTRLCLRAGSRIVLLGPDGERVLNGPGCFAAEAAPRIRSYAYATAPAPAAPRRTRGGAIRGTAPSAMFVIRGSPKGLAFYPVGSRVSGSGRICLPPDAGFLTFQRQTGGLVTYGEGGCNRVIPEPKPGEGTEGAGSGP